MGITHNVQTWGSPGIRIPTALAESDTRQSRQTCRGVNLRAFVAQLKYNRIINVKIFIVESKLRSSLANIGSISF